VKWGTIRAGNENKLKSAVKRGKRSVVSIKRCSIGREHIEKILNWLQEEGLGSDRSLDEGKFDVIEFEDLGNFERISPE